MTTTVTRDVIVAFRFSAYCFFTVGEFIETRQELYQFYKSSYSSEYICMCIFPLLLLNGTVNSSYLARGSDFLPSFGWFPSLLRLALILSGRHFFLVSFYLLQTNEIYRERIPCRTQGCAPRRGVLHPFAFSPVLV